MKNIFIVAGITILLTTACSKDENKEQLNASVIKTDVMLSIANNVIVPTYTDMNLKANALYTSIVAFNSNSSDSNLLVCQNAWYNVRNAWEQSEGFLFGPVSIENIDPRIDTWPINYQSLDSVLANNATFTNTYIESLEDALRGFHPIEYLLFGKNKSKKATEFNQRQKDYLLALSENLKGLCYKTISEWNNGFYADFTMPSSKSVYKSEREVYEEITNAIIGICDEVANEKINTPFIAQDPSLEESPFALNSMADFKNNMTSVSNIYYGKYAIDGKGLEDFVKLYNLSLNNKIKQNIDAINNSFTNITLPFGEAITAQGTQIQNLITNINNLKIVLEEELLPLVKQHTNS